MYILAHRGISLPGKQYPESSVQAFADCLAKGFGIEFDVNFTVDNKIIIWHDEHLGRLFNNKNKPFLEEITLADFKKIKVDGCSFCELADLLELIKQPKIKLNALHCKGKFQDKDHLDLLIKDLLKYKSVLSKVFIFDLKPESARYLKSKLPKMNLACSVAHFYDKKRFNQYVDGTLLTIGEAIKNKKLYNWVWLDEWDRLNTKGEKIFYNEKNFKLLRKNNFKIALVTPELHCLAPNKKYGGHQDAQTKVIWRERIKEIINLQPDLVCTDYPDYFN